MFSFKTFNCVSSLLLFQLKKKNAPNVLLDNYFYYYYYVMIIMNERNIYKKNVLRYDVD